jgi:predicted enzyme related to lactoylglutathione lyase
MPPSQRGRFVWYDLMTTDPAAAPDFYRNVIGWTTTEWDGPMPYTMFQRDGDVQIGGIMQLPDEAQAQGAPPHWLVYIGANDVDATVDQAKQAGAETRVEPTDVPNVGRFAVLADPQGANFGTFAGEAANGDFEPQIGDASWHELVTADYEAAFGFYDKLFGWQQFDAMDMGGGAMYQMFGQDGKMYGGMMNFMPEMPPMPYWVPYFRVTSLDGCVERVGKLGGQILNPPMEVPGGDRVAMCMDAQGAAFGMHETKTG